MSGPHGRVISCAHGRTGRSVGARFRTRTRVVESGYHGNGRACGRDAFNKYLLPVEMDQPAFAPPTVSVFRPRADGDTCVRWRRRRYTRLDPPTIARATGYNGNAPPSIAVADFTVLGGGIGNCAPDFVGDVRLDARWCISDCKMCNV